MDFAFSPNEEQFRSEVRSFLDDVWPAHYRTVGAQGRASEEFAERALSFRKALAQRGWFSMGIPEEYGGIPGFTSIQKFIVADECSRIGAPLPAYLVSIMGPMIMQYGTPWMKQELLPKIRAGEVNFVFGFTEPENGSDLANCQTRAVRDGDEYVINGQKIYGHPQEGDIMFLAVKTAPERYRQGVSVLMVETWREGFSALEMPTLDGRHVGATFYDDVRVPADHLVGEENGGWNVLRESLDLDRTSGITYGYLRPRVEQLIDAVKQSTVNGQRLADDPWVRDRLAQMVIELEAGETLQGMTASKIASGMKLRTESSVVKIFLTEFAKRIAEFGMEVAGPLGVLTFESEIAPFGGQIENLHRANVAATIAGGTNEIQRNIIALQGLGLPRG